MWTITTSDADSEQLLWSTPRRLCDGVMMGKPLILATGAWVLPVSFWHRRDVHSAGLVVSTDGGATWRERGAFDVPPAARDYDEHILVEQRAGVLWMWVRNLPN
ncbi:MAG: exo-alpha-sialidase [Anaerolineae bacterium]|nr:exo-alpha-sialidase [Anaerolineae bacterium]